MHFLIVGLGSIGQRHLKNLATLGFENFTVVSQNRSLLPRTNLPAFRQVANLEEGLALNPDAALLCNPNALRISTAIQAAKAGCHLFLEKPISHQLEGVAELTDLINSQELIVQSGFQFRFHPILQKIKKAIDQNQIGKIISAQVHWGEYLPWWHPYEDYRQSYAARRDLGGGVVNTLCHPFDYLRWLLGEVRSLYSMTGRLSSLELTTEDTAMTLLRFQNGALGSVYLDYVERPRRHTMTIIGETGKIEWNNHRDVATLYSEESSMVTPLSCAKDFERNGLFLAEMEEFTTAINEKRQPAVTLADGIEALKLTLAVHESSQTQSEVLLEDSLFSNSIKI